MIEKMSRVQFDQTKGNQPLFYDEGQFKKTIFLKMPAQSARLKEESKSAISQKVNPQKYKQKQLGNPIVMDSTMLSYLYSQRVASMITMLSIILSLVEVYSWVGDKHQYESTFYIIGHGLTIILGIIVVTSHYLNREKDIARGLKPGLRVFSFIINLVIIIPHPFQLISQYDYLLHLLLFLRLSIPFQYVIRSSMYHNSRGNRLINLYGIDSNSHFSFSVKSIVEGLKLYQIFFVHLVMAVIFSHALYIVTLHGMQMDDYDSQILSFTDCFQIVIVTMPTVGYGQYNLTQTGQRIIIFLVISFSAAFNSFVTVSMLRLLQMGPRQISSYRLQKKIRIRQTIEEISKNYIIETFQQIKSKSSNLQYRKQLDYTFRSMYRQQKAMYDSLNNNQIDKNFTYFRESLHDLYIKNFQTNEMIDTLLKKLICTHSKKRKCNQEASIKVIQTINNKRQKLKRKKLQTKRGFIRVSSKDECIINVFPQQKENSIHSISLNSGCQKCQRLQRAQQSKADCIHGRYSQFQLIKQQVEEQFRREGTNF